MKGMMKQSLLLLAGCWMLLVSEASAEIETRIIGGEISDENAWPATVALVLDNQFCAGTLVDRRWVVTAAHCLFGQNGSRIPVEKIRVLAGSTQLDSPDMQQILVANAYVHPDYALDQLDYDVALLELGTEADLPAMPIDMNPDVPAVGTMATVVGWGITEESDGIVNDLREMEVPIISNETCNAPESYGGIITSNMMCAGYPEGGIDTCSGDSGGPLMVYRDGAWRLTGVVSFGYETCAEPDKYGVYMRISAFVRWLDLYVKSGVADDHDDNGGGGAPAPLLLLLLALFLIPGLGRVGRY
jgi:secreted trypsin-like serine protease